MAELDALVALKAHPEERWTAGRLAPLVQKTDRATEALLDDLCKRGLCKASGSPKTYAYHIKDAALNQAFLSVVLVCAVDRKSVLRFLTG